MVADNRFHDPAAPAKKELINMNGNGKKAAVWTALGAIIIALGLTLPKIFDGDATTIPDWGALTAAFGALIALIFRGTK